MYTHRVKVERAAPVVNSWYEDSPGVVTASWHYATLAPKRVDRAVINTPAGQVAITVWYFPAGVDVRVGDVIAEAHTPDGTPLSYRERVIEVAPMGSRTMVTTTKAGVMV